MKAHFSLILIILAACGAQTEPLAKLTFVSGDVLVNGAAAGLGHALTQGDIVETLTGSQATITFYNSSIVRLSEATTLELSELTESRMVKLKQTTGETWTRVLKITGIGEYKIETPNAVATVRGTGFKVAVQESKTEVSVGEGTVHVAKLAEGEIVAEASVEADQRAIIDQTEAEALAAEQILIEEIDTDEFLSENLEEDERLINELMERFDLDQLFGELDDIISDAEKLISRKISIEPEEPSQFDEQLAQAESTTQLIDDEEPAEKEKTTKPRLETDPAAQRKKPSGKTELPIREPESGTQESNIEKEESNTTNSEQTTIYRIDEKREIGTIIYK